MIATAERTRLQRQPLPDDEFVELLDVPVFSEHTNREGVRIDEAALRATCDRCNERISETGDFCPVVVGHTSDDGKEQPRVIGFVEKFSMGTIGDKRKKAAIFAKFKIFKEDEHELKRHPRRSVEFWASEDNPTEGYFDPISLLGATTPELDLSVRYAKGRKGHRLFRYSKVERYEASFPGGSNTFVPTTSIGTGSTKKPKVTRLDGKPLNTDDQYETSIKYGAGNVPLTSDDLQQLVIALTPVIQTTVNEAVRAATAEEPEIDPDLDVPGGDMGLDAPGGDEAVPGLDGAELDAPGGDLGLDAPGGDEEMGGEGDDDLVDEVPDDDEDEEDEDDISAAPPPKKKKPAAKFAKDPAASDHYSKLCEYSDEKEAEKYFAGLDDTGKQQVRASIDGDSDTDRKIKMRKKYMATTATDSDPVVPAPSTGLPTATQYAKERKEHADLRTRYAKLNRENSELLVKYAKQEEELSVVRADKKQAVRYQKLAELASQGYCLDPHDEMEETDQLTDEQFESHCTRVVTKYQRVPLGLIPVPKPLTYDGSTREAKSQKYAKQARDNVLAARNKGETMDYAKELNRLIDADTTVGKTKETAGAK